MSSNKKVMSLAIKPELHEELKRVSKRKGLSASAWIGTLVEQALKVNPDEDAMVIGKPMDEDIMPVILKIPGNLKGNPEQLQKWLNVQMNGILKAMSKKATPDAPTAS